MRSFDYKHYKDMVWDVELINMVSRIHEYKGRQELYLHQKPEILDKLVEVAKIQSTESSNKIEGIVTTRTRLKKIYEDKTSPKNRDEEEIMGYRNVLNTIHENYSYIPIRSSYMLQLHKELYRYSSKGIGGSFKNTQNIIAKTLSDGTSSVLFTPLAPYETPEAIEAICQSFNQMIEENDFPALLLIPIFILDFLCIHPFNDGNGRMSRLLTTLLLYRQGYVVGKYISIEKLIEESKVTYYEVLEESDLGWHQEENNPLPFIKYFLRIILAAYREFEERVDIFTDRKSAYEQVKSAVESQFGKFSKSDIMELCPALSVSSVESSLRNLIEENQIERHGQGKSTYYLRT